MRDSDDERPTDAIDVPEPQEEEDTNVTDERLGPGAEVGGYIIDGELGHGTMGMVYASTHPVIGKRAAIKVLRAEMSRDPERVERFINEARAVNAIGHPNIVDIFAFGTLHDGRSYCVMDLLVGETLKQRLKRGPLHVSEASSAIDEIASALMAAHAKGIIHRDLKPDNIFMVSVPGRWPEVKLLDFGLAKLMGKRLSTTKLRTVTGSVMGTPAYMSPEQARASDQVDQRTDIYSLGVVSYELLTGEAPFKKTTSIDTLLAHQEDPVPPLIAKVPNLPEELTQLIEAMLAKEPDGRPTLAAVRAVIKRLKGTKIPTMSVAGLSMSLPTPTAVDNPFIEPPSYSDVVTRPRMKSLSPLSIPTPTPEGTPAPELMPPTRAPSSPSSAPVNKPATTLAGHSMPLAKASRQSGPSVPMPMGGLPPGYPLYPQGSMPPQALRFPSAAGLLPPEPPERASQQASYRWLVIVIVAVVASAIGILIAVLA